MLDWNLSLLYKCHWTKLNLRCGIQMLPSARVICIIKIRQDQSHILSSGIPSFALWEFRWKLAQPKFSSCIIIKNGSRGSINSIYRYLQTEFGHPCASRWPSTVISRYSADLKCTRDFFQCFIRYQCFRIRFYCSKLINQDDLTNKTKWRLARFCVTRNRWAVRVTW